MQQLGVTLEPIDPNVYTGERTPANFLWPVVDTLAINGFLWFVPWAMGSHFSSIGPEYWKNNLKSGFQWDDNELEINQLFHPYQGGMYFTTARVNGLTFWESVPYTLFGSWQWEYFMETEQASTNDFVATTWGGFFFGESLYRLSNRILDSSRSGSTRFLKEFAGMAVSPINGLSRVTTGRAWADGPSHKPVPLLVDVKLGAVGLGLGDDTGWGTMAHANIRFDYGDRYAKPKISVPFESFDLSIGVMASTKMGGVAFDGNGILLGRRFAVGKNDNMIAWTLDYTFSTNATNKMLTRETDGVYQLGEIGTGPSWFGRWKLAKDLALDTQLDALAVPTGAVTSPYAVYEVNRAYNYGIGGALKAEASLRHKRLGRVYANVDRYLYSNVNGARGVENVGLFKLNAYANLYKGHGLGGGVTYYNRASYYDDYKDIHDSFWSGQAHYEYEW